MMELQLNAIHKAKFYTLKQEQADPNKLIKCELEGVSVNSSASKHVVICVSGFLSEKANSGIDWKGLTEYL